MNPYSDLPKTSFWRTGVAEASPYAPVGIYEKKWEIGKEEKVAAAGSCFAQHVSRNLKTRGFNVIDKEPAPYGLPENLRGKFGYEMYSARYGNIYTAHQLLQLAKEAILEEVPADPVWKGADGRYHDAFRPNVEPAGLETREEVEIHRRQHLKCVRSILHEMDVFVFTFGLTEAWVHKETGTVYPTAPGVLAGTFDEDRYQFKNYNYSEVMSAFLEFIKIVTQFRNGREFRTLVTVSPVPLTATATGKHILPATIYSKSVLRAVAGDLSEQHGNIDYFPSYEIITNQAAQSRFYAENLRSIRAEGVETAMKAFFSEHGEDEARLAQMTDVKAEDVASGMEQVERIASESESEKWERDIICEDELLEGYLK
ncbi:MAG: GSCFA domain-containing protein [Rhodobacteraceae bacterium]|nr:GSCFA domain-containing protein [Paracoccaceae bacterium]